MELGDVREDFFEVDLWLLSVSTLAKMEDGRWQEEETCESLR